ncbi:MAG: sensor histidine kinase [Gammaproteobacteria bacterium]|nr:sensor histidine kinase [Gammaproteobacteria bacterium]
MREAADGTFLPNFCAIRSVFVVVVSAELLAIILTLATFPAMDAFWAELSLRSLYVQWIALSATALLCVLRPVLDGLSHAAGGVLAWLVILAVTLGVFLVARHLGLQGRGASTLVLLQHLAIAGIVGAMLLRYLYEQYRERQRELAESRARVEALQARIRPHFLFNSMNTIASLTRLDPVLAEQTVQDLSDLFRATLSSSAGRSTLQQELELSRGYLRIEAQRLGDRLHVDWRIDDVPTDIAMPALLLQPLLENAVYHGVEPSSEATTIRVSLQCEARDLVIMIENPVGTSVQTTGREGHRIAQDNVRQRLDAVYGARASMDVTQRDGNYRVALRIPLDRQT